jgi:hypothetical protein
MGNLGHGLRLASHAPLRFSQNGIHRLAGEETTQHERRHDGLDSMAQGFDTLFERSNTGSFVRHIFLQSPRNQMNHERGKRIIKGQPSLSEVKAEASRLT